MKTLTIALILASTLVFNLNAAKPTASRPQAVAGAIASNLKNKYITAQPSTDKIEMTVTHGTVSIEYPYTITLTPDRINLNVAKVDYDAPWQTEDTDASYKYTVGSNFKKVLKIINSAKIETEDDVYIPMLDGEEDRVSISLYKNGKPYAKIHYASTENVLVLAKQIQNLIPNFDNEYSNLQSILDSNAILDTNPNSYHDY